jgi:hypothetical protein
VPPLRNADFFNLGILNQIEADQPKPARREAGPVSSWRLIWAGASCLAIAVIILFAFVLPSLHPVRREADYFAEILNSQPGDSSISAVAFHSEKENVTVLWLDGLDYVPSVPHP